MAEERFSLKDHLFNPESIGDLADEFSVLPGFDRDTFHAEVCAGLQGRELMERLEWIADCLEGQLARDFPSMADQLEAAMPAPLDPTLRDDDFGRFIHAVPGILAVRHGLEDHRERALDLLHVATQRFSMEFYIRPFLNRWPEETLERLRVWARDENYHVRRLVSEGTRPKLPWAKAISLDPLVPLEFLDALHADPTRFVTRSVANHLNDIAKIAPDVVLTYLAKWRDAAQQTPKELAWMERHALRTLIKDGHARAMAHLGYRSNAAVSVTGLTLTPEDPAIGDVMEITFTLEATEDSPVIVDYAMHFLKANGTTAPKVFKIKDTSVTPKAPVTLTKRHRFKGNATTFTLYPGTQKVTVHVNGVVKAEATFTLR
ncbi:DNA alkylation repair protein [Shimia ponticola]|uniref:DNA alkylation repair protein n=1 Tax=Shimia ponticola TaxID=2582893 RepID=UPI002103EDE4|nr:DNA alkylation repair protein [Shimia ponticola]